LYTGFRLDYKLRLWAPTSASRAISAVSELLVVLGLLFVAYIVHVSAFVILKHGVK